MDGERESFWVARRRKDGMFVCDQMIGRPPDGSGDDRESMAHYLHDGNREAFGVRGQDEDVGGAVSPLEIISVDMAEHVDVVREPHEAHAAFENLSMWALAGDAQATRAGTAHEGKGAEQIENPFLGYEPCYAEQRGGRRA